VDAGRGDRIAGHGEPPRGLESPAAGPLAPARFAPMLERSGACEAGLDAIKSLVGVMNKRVGDEGPTQNSKVAAGFTYLAQFIDHDLTFDPTPFTDRERDPHAHVDFRTPRFDLDSVYGLGPDMQPFLYDRDSDPKGVRLLVGFNPEDGTADVRRACG
jgi:hypothetical protein